MSVGMGKRRYARDVSTYTCPDSLGTFVDVEEVADSVSSTVSGTESSVADDAFSIL